MRLNRWDPPGAKDTRQCRLLSRLQRWLWPLQLFWCTACLSLLCVEVRPTRQVRDLCLTHPREDTSHEFQSPSRLAEEERGALDTRLGIASHASVASTSKHMCHQRDLLPSETHPPEAVTKPGCHADNNNNFSTFYSFPRQRGPSSFAPSPTPFTGTVPTYTKRQ